MLIGRATNRQPSSVAESTPRCDSPRRAPSLTRPSSLPQLGRATASRQTRTRRTSTLHCCSSRNQRSPRTNRNAGHRRERTGPVSVNRSRLDSRGEPDCWQDHSRFRMSATSAGRESNGTWPPGSKTGSTPSRFVGAVLSHAGFTSASSVHPPDHNLGETRARPRSRATSERPHSRSAHTPSETSRRATRRRPRSCKRRNEH